MDFDRFLDKLKGLRAHVILPFISIPLIDMTKKIVIIAVSVLALLLLFSQFPTIFVANRHALRNNFLSGFDPSFLSAVQNHSVTASSENMVPRIDTRLPTSSSQNASLLHETGIGEKRRFIPIGSGAHLFIEMAAYRIGRRDFSVVGLGSKPIHVFSDASFKCEWRSNNRTFVGKAIKMLPDWGYGRVYTTVVVSCSFRKDVGTASEGGDLILYASPDQSFDNSKTEKMVVLRESPGIYNDTIFSPPYPYEYVYCGSPLYGDISPQRVREWVAYHVKFFGPRSHFFFYDAGGIHPGVQTILEPWIKAGRISVQDVRDQEQFDGYYHNQFLIVNDCLHRTRFLTNWTFFFDVDEFLYIPESSSLESVLAEHSRFTQIFFNQRPMSSRLCKSDSKTNQSELWAIEKLIFHSVKKGVRRDRKYAIQPRNVYATGVHLTENLRGKSMAVREEKLRYYHYHGTLSERTEVCREFTELGNKSTDVVWSEKEPFKAEYSMQSLAGAARLFELQQIGDQQPFLL